MRGTVPATAGLSRVRHYWTTYVAPPASYTLNFLPATVFSDTSRFSILQLLPATTPPPFSPRKQCKNSLVLPHLLSPAAIWPVWNLGPASMAFYLVNVIYVASQLDPFHSYLTFEQLWWGWLIVLETLFSLTVWNTLLSLFIPVFLLIPSQFLSSIPKCLCFPVIISSHFSLLPLSLISPTPMAVCRVHPSFYPQPGTLSWSDSNVHLPEYISTGMIQGLIKLNTSHTDHLISDLSSGSHVLPAALPFPSREDISICQFLPQKSVSLLLPSSSSFPTPLLLAQSLGHVYFIS